MIEALFVLWVYSPTPWVWQGLPMTPGWAAQMVLDHASCHAALPHFNHTVRAVCLPSTERPRALADFDASRRPGTVLPP